MNPRALGIAFALAAAGINGTVGLFAKSASASGLGMAAIAFYKCLLAMLMTGLILVAQRRLTDTVKAAFGSGWIALAAFFGVFVMTTFEIRAYSLQSVGTTVLMFMVGTSVTTQALARIILGERLTAGRAFALGISLSGVYLILREELLVGTANGCFFAAIAGAGYGTYLVIAQKRMIASSVSTIFQLTLLGTLFLFPEYAASGLALPTQGWWALVGLALFPTIMGYYFTTLAVSYMEASRVQLYEVAEPFFAVFLAWLFLNESMTAIQVVGGACIVLAAFAGDRIDGSLQKEAVAEQA